MSRFENIQYLINSCIRTYVCGVQYTYVCIWILAKSILFVFLYLIFVVTATIT